MAYYPDVTPGTPISFSAKRETEINRLLNQADQFKTGVIAGKTSPVVRVQVWNSTQTAFAAGQAVQIDVSGSLCGNAFPAVNFASVDAPFGVCANGIAPNAIGDLIFSGPATVTISGSSGNYAKPVSGGTFVRGNEGVKILHVSGTRAIVLLGDYHTPSGGGGGSVGSPDYLSPLVEIGDVLAQTYYPGTAYPEGQAVWLIGNLTAFPDEDGQIVLSVRVLIRNGGNSESVYLTDFRTQQNSYIDKFSVPVSLLIPADYEFEIDILQGTGNDFTSELAIYPCI